MCLAKESAEIVQANGSESMAESVDGSAPGDSLAALKLADLQLQNTDAGRCDLDCLQTLIC